MATALVLVDAQRNMLEPPMPVPGAGDVRAALQGLLDRARHDGVLVVQVQNDGTAGDPDEPGSPGWELVFAPSPQDIVVRKDQPDAFASNPSLAEELKRRDISRLVMAGMQSNYRVAATSRAGLANGFEVVLASGAHATYDEDQPAAIISSEIEKALIEEGVMAVPAATVTFG